MANYLRPYYHEFLRGTGKENNESIAYTWLCFQDEYNTMSQEEAYQVVNNLNDKGVK